ncbi:uncharacterized protein SPSK_10095 [Sporothrix schenckii 1099-18]|uniref:Uncharacterized protein n=1 Tax=Sporothrix schenckii 1099-18 TaxID=1397361 RepID=A0A0F2M7K0_SPOSC|nr:uncharacterized protein SPSK_10095 [Sporothrix schenckii 1099-18]KJR85668.1 hypothetical protein SPSK_10095 [Sporothrix schenckii 1099-18]
MVGFMACLSREDIRVSDTLLHTHGRLTRSGPCQARGLVLMIWKARESEASLNVTASRGPDGADLSCQDKDKTVKRDLRLLKALNIANRSKRSTPPPARQYGYVRTC